MTTPEVHNALSPLGISQAAEICYRELVQAGPSTVERIAERLSDPAARTTEATLESLADLGMAVRNQEIWEAQPLARVVGSLREAKARELASAVAASELLDAQLAVVRHRYSRAIYTVVGRDAIVAARETLLKEATSELMGFDRPPYLRENHKIPQQTPELDAVGRGLAMRTVYAPGFDAERSAALRRFTDAGEQVRVAVVPIKMLVIDNRTALLARVPASASAVPELCIVNDPIVVGALAQMFEEVWARAIPLNPDDPDATRHSSLIGLLMAGYTDAAIASRLGVTERSVRRWVAQLMESYGVRTRLQLGGAIALDPTVKPD